MEMTKADAVGHVARTSMAVITRLEYENKRLREVLRSLLDDKHITYSVRAQCARDVLEQ